jgi:hypothetical protein
MKRIVATLLLLAISLYAGDKGETTTHPLTITNVTETVTITGSVEGTVQFTLFDLKGRKLYRMRQLVHVGENQLNLPASLQKNRVLVLEMSDGHWKYTEQLVL